MVISLISSLFSRKSTSIVTAVNIEAIGGSLLALPCAGLESTALSSLPRYAACVHSPLEVSSLVVVAGSHFIEPCGHSTLPVDEHPLATPFGGSVRLLVGQRRVVPV